MVILCVLFIVLGKVTNVLCTTPSENNNNNNNNNIKNAVVGTPEVQCMEDKLKLNVATDQPFTGNIFVKGKYSDDACVQKYRDNRHRGAYFMVQLGRCGMQRLRSASPRGMNFVITVVVNFHPLFVTHVDRAYNIRCFYMETDELVSSKMEVSMIPTTNLYDSMSMPKCKYTVRLQSPQGQEVTFAKVGDSVFHVWECSGPDMGILIKKCFVNDGSGQEVSVVDFNGCTTDTQLLSELTYDSSLMKAWAQSLVFKYADKNTLYFTCQVYLCQKQLGMCDGVTPPKCSNHSVHRYKRDYDSENSAFSTDYTTMGIWSKNTLDVTTDELTVLDLQKQLAISQGHHSKRDNRSTVTAAPEAISEKASTEFVGKRFCISVPLFSACICFALVLVVVSSACSVIVYKNRVKKVADKLNVHFAPATYKI